MPGAVIGLRETCTNRGRGVFATEDIKKGTLVTELYGHRVSLSKMDELRAAKDKRVLYSAMGFYSPKKTFHVLGISEPEIGRGLGSFVNDARGTSFEANCEFVTATDNKIYVCAMRDISESEELFVDYGDEYWGDFAEFA